MDRSVINHVMQKEYRSSPTSYINGEIENQKAHRLTSHHYCAIGGRLPGYENSSRGFCCGGIRTRTLMGVPLRVGLRYGIIAHSPRFAIRTFLCEGKLL